MNESEYEIFLKRLISFILALILILPPAALAYTEGDRLVVANCSEYVTLRTGPSKGAAKSIRIPPGRDVTYLGDGGNGFAYVQYADRKGYVLEEYLEPYSEPWHTARTQTPSGHPVYCGNHGTAKYIWDRTVVVAIYADDATTHWDFSREADTRQRLRNRFNMGVACAWLTQQARRYHGDCGGFVWNWYEHGDLYYTHAFTQDIVHGMGGSDAVNAIVGYIHENVPTQELLTRYGAENIIYNVYLNAPNDESYRSWSTGVLNREINAEQYYPEACVFVPYGRGRENTPAVFAHEMLHCFGAYDLYETYNGSPITQAYVNHLMSHSPNDLMNHCYFSDYDIITTEFSAIDAYYVGLTGRPAEADRWGLGLSTYERFPEN